MTVPLERLYEYIEIVAKKCINDTVLIYHFFPHGSKNIENLTPWKRLDNVAMSTSPQIYCHDQEPLNFDHFEHDHNPLQKLWVKYNLPLSNLRCFPNVYDQCVLLHSEIGGSNLEKYRHQGNFVLAYYWSHALIARDWYRFAEYVAWNKQAKNVFLIYNRAWSGTREYRLKFLEYLVESNLVGCCNVTLTAVDPENKTHFKDHSFKNSIWKPKIDFENLFRKNQAPSHSSADFDLDDYNSTHIEVVLETLFDDDRIHLTEKILRPIACGQPFLLASTAGSLEILKKYGFKTFDCVWPEQYDSIADPYARLQKVVETMKEIANWDRETFEQKMSMAKEIADHNRKWFFSATFFDQINNELSSNLCAALTTVKVNNTSQVYIDRFYKTEKIQEINQLRESELNKQEIKQILSIAHELNKLKMQNK